MGPRSRIRARATYANVTATLALFVALGGGSFAVATLSGTEKKVVKKIARKQAGKQITARAPTLRVRHAGSADVAAPGGTAGGDLTGSYPDPEVGPNEITFSHIRDGQLNDEDVGQGTFVDFDATIGTVAAGDCVTSPITGIGAENDHLLLTPNWNTTSSSLIYSITYYDGAEYAYLQTCNPTGAPINEGNALFNLLVFDAQ